MAEFWNPTGATQQCLHATLRRRPNLPAPGKLSGSGFWVQDLEHVAADPPMPYARPYSGFFHDAYSGEPAQDICGAGLTHIQFVLYIPEGENWVSE